MDTPPTRWWVALAVVLVSGWLLWLLGPVLTPFVTAALLAYLGDPLADRLQRLGLGRSMSVVGVFLVLLLLLTLLLLVLVPLLYEQVLALIERLPAYARWFQERILPWLVDRLGVPADAFALSSLGQALQEHWQAAGGVAARVLSGVTSSGMALLTVLINLFLIPVLTFYLLRDWDVLIARIDELLLPHWRSRMRAWASEADATLAAFLRGQLTVMAALATLYTVGLWIVGLEFALLIGFFAGLVSFVPYLGVFSGLLLASIVAMLQGAELWTFAGIGVVFTVAQMAEGFVLTPLLVGDRVGLHPVAVIFAVMAGGQLFGLAGILLALPIASVLAVALRHMYRYYMQRSLLDLPE